jgi:hypothetical protein
MPLLRVHLIPPSKEIGSKRECLVGGAHWLWKDSDNAALLGVAELVADHY